MTIFFQAIGVFIPKLTIDIEGNCFSLTEAEAKRLKKTLEQGILKLQRERLINAMSEGDQFFTGKVTDQATIDAMEID
ncbi:hypothetical protein ACMYR3_16985 (plasmid) [Ampullimonas aquatilis]|uniref:hypothetical protein n=1 Tax=Ampullimonas aquatilis TaxID=1341549 RepID=UPI003C737000